MEKDGIMNIFPLPGHNDTINLTHGRLFPAPNVLEKGLQMVYNQISNHQWD